VKIAPQYPHPVVHVLDASRVVGVVSQLLNPQTCESFAMQVAREQEERRQDFLRKQNRPLLTLAEARANRLPIDWATAPIERPSFLGTRELASIRLSTLAEYIDWTPFFHVWELRGRYPALLDDPVVGAQARELFADAQALLADIVAHQRFGARAVVGFFPANSAGDDLVLYTDESRAEVREVLHTLRQQTPKQVGRPSLALSDFVAPQESGRADYVGGFVVTAGHGVDELVHYFEAARDDYSAILVKALADRLAEACAEYVHEQVRRELWGYSPGEHLSKEDLLRERYRGI
jgi:5-methyltetrahydrofolate--homocysteine methyltransferase